MKTPFDIAREVVAEEAAALARLAETLSTEAAFNAILQTIARAERPIIISGLGKSGNIAQKIAATLTSTGTPAVFMHPVEALHGDLGIVTDRHCLIALSRSGNTEEILRFVAHFRRLGGPVIALTQGAKSKLVELSQHTLALPDLPEAGPLNLAPTTSCLLQLAAGDALAMALLHQRGFKPEQFAQYHPEGPLGRRLLLTARDLMHGGDGLPVVRADESVKKLITEMTKKPLGVALIVDANARLIGTFTDGDWRRLIDRVEQFHSLSAHEAYTASRRTASQPAVPISAIRPDCLAIECLQIMRTAQITCLVITESDDRPVGLLRLADLINAGIG